MKTCRRCSRTLPLDQFYAHQMMKDGLLNFCKECVKERVRAHRDENIERVREAERIRSKTDRSRTQAKEAQVRARERHPLRYRARMAVGNALRDGRLARVPCEGCGDVKSQAHHDDYAKPLDVRWLCFKCHRKHHGQYKDHDSAR